MEIALGCPLSDIRSCGLRVILIQMRLRSAIAENHPELLAEMGGFPLIEPRLQIFLGNARTLWGLPDRTDFSPEVIALGKQRRRAYLAQLLSAGALIMLVILAA